MCTLIIKEDGDYFDMYLDNPTGTPIMTFAIGDRMKVIDKLESVVLGEKIDLTDITFPRHADGTCDYDDIAPTANESQDIEEMATESAPATERAEPAEEAAILRPTPAMGKTAVVTENLRLRLDYDTTAEVVATLAAGTRVQVLSLGKEDTIDGIKSNWVWVETFVGAKDKDGNAIEAGTKGWLFGGYLSETEDMADAKQNAVPPILPIATGIEALAVLLAVVLIAVKKRKAGKE